MDLVIAEGAVGAELPLFELVVFGVITMISSIVVVFKEQLRPFRDLSKSLLFQ